MRGNKYFRIRYGDGDEEDITLTTLQQILVDDEEKFEKKNKGGQAVAGKKKRKAPPPSLSKPGKRTSKTVKPRAPASATAAAAAAAAPKSKQMKLSQPTRGKVAAKPAEAQRKEQEIEIEKVSEDEEEEKSPPPTTAAIESARAHISSVLTAGKKMLLGENEGGQQQEHEDDAGPTNRLQELLTQSEGDTDEEEQEEEEGVNEGIAPHEFLHPFGGNKGALPASSPSTGANMKQGRGLPTKSAPAKQKQQESIKRFGFSGRCPTDGIRASAAVAANGLLFIGDLTHPGIIACGQQENTPPELYNPQIVEIFEDLDEILKKAGNLEKESLVSVDVQFKDSAVGYGPFIEEWNKWLGDSPAPVCYISFRNCCFSSVPRSRLC